jgi:hypothetical protein
LAMPWDQHGERQKTDNCNGDTALHQQILHRCKCVRPVPVTRRTGATSFVEAIPHAEHTYWHHAGPPKLDGSRVLFSDGGIGG